MPKGFPKNGINKGWFKANHMAWNKGVNGCWSEDVCKRKSNAMMGNSNPMKRTECNEKLRIASSRRTHSKEEKTKISDSVKNSYDSKLREVRRKQMIEHNLLGNNNDTYIERKVENWLLFNNILYVKQYPIEVGIADFYLPESNLIIECDGDYWHNMPNRVISDKRKDEYLLSNEYNILRLPEYKINTQFNECMNNIKELL